MNANELQNEVDTHEEIHELTIEELDAVGGGSGGGARPHPIVMA
jgi:hypothetical protein